VLDGSGHHFGSIELFAASAYYQAASLYQGRMLCEAVPETRPLRGLLRYICARITASTPLQRRAIAAIARGQLRFLG